MIYVRWKLGEPRRTRTFDPLKAAHPLVDVLCPACTAALGTAHRVTLVAVGPDDDETAVKHQAGRWYSAAATAAHEACVAGMADEHLDVLVDVLVAQKAPRR